MQRTRLAPRILLLALTVTLALAAAPARAASPARLAPSRGAPLALVAATQGTPIGFEEAFALATDREAVLAQLLPGTPDYYYYHCLQRQHEARFDEAAGLLKQWIERHGRDARTREIEQRQMLLTFELDPEATYEALRDTLRLNFAHQRQIPGEVPNLPTRLDPALLDWARLAQHALARYSHSVEGFRPAAYDRIVGLDLGDDRLADLLERAAYPDLPNLPELVTRALANPKSGSFGSRSIHSKLTLEQLEACALLRPQLLNDSVFVETVLPRLAPGADEAGSRDPAVYSAHLERLWAFADRLAPAHNSLKAHVLYHRLWHDWLQGTPDRARFLRYLQLPRSAGYVNPKYRDAHRTDRVNTNASYPTGLAAVGNDEKLVRTYLAHFLVQEDGIDSFSEYVESRLLERVLAEAKILAGAGDLERWYSLVDDPGFYEELEQRVELEFAPTTQREYAADESVTIDVDVKNVPTLIVKVFEVNALGYYLAEEREVDESIELDGLVAGSERTLTYTDSPYRRVRRTFEFPSLARPGVYVVEFLGGGTSSRAVIRKGGLTMTERVGAAGHVFYVVDELGRRVPDATLRLGGRLYVPEEGGALVVPFAGEAATRKVVLEGAGRVALAEFDQVAENFELESGFHVEREALLAGNTAQLLVRPVLRAGGRSVSLALLEDVRLELVAVGTNGEVLTTETVPIAEFDASGTYVHEFPVPEHLGALNVSLRGTAERSGGGRAELETGQRRFELNGIENSNLVATPLLGRSPEGYVLDILGRNGEPVVDLGLNIHLEHRYVTHSIDVALKTDAAGRVHLGPLPDVKSIRADVPGAQRGDWVLEDAQHSLRSLIQGRDGADLRVPYSGSAQRLSRDVAALFELRGERFTTDRFSHLHLEPGYLVLRGLPAGDYELYLKEAASSIAVRVTDGDAVQGWGVGRRRMLQLTDPAPMQLVALEVVGDELVARIANAGPRTRLHLWADRYLPAYDPFSRLMLSGDPAPGELELEPRASVYRAGRVISDEYRYILERRFAQKFPGNMLMRPELLLNPWSQEETSAVIGAGGGAGGAFGGRSRGRRNLKAAGGKGFERAPGANAHAFAELEFLPAAAAQLLDLRPDADGVVRVPLAELGQGNYVVALAVDDEELATDQLVLAETPLEPADLRLANGLEPTSSIVRRGTIEFLDAGESVTFEQVRVPEMNVYGSLGDIYRYARNEYQERGVDAFEELLRWPELTDEERLEFLSDNASHELHVFLHEKDPEFFDAIVRPYLANKAHKTFLDHWLLDDDLTGYLQPWDFSHLNVVERILLLRRVGDPAGAARHVRERFELLPRDVAEQARRFEAALRGDVLAMGAADVQWEMERGSDDLFLGHGDKRARGGPAPPSPSAARAVPAEEPVLRDAELKELQALGYANAEADEAPEKDLARRKQSKALWQDAGRTRAYVEQNYWRRTVDQTGPNLILPNAFWLDFATTPADAPFRSTHFLDATQSFAEVWLALSFLDLPFESSAYELSGVDGVPTLTAGGPLLLVRRELAEAVPAEDEAPLLLGQNFLRISDRYTESAGVRREKFVTSEFLVGTPYVCKVVVTNPTSEPRELELLLQVPEGALPLDGARETDSRALQLDAYQTRAIEFAFYFPRAGEFAHFPAQVSRAGAAVASAAPATLNVVVEPSQIDTNSWEYISQRGTNAEVLAFLAAENVERLNLTRISWRMRDREFFTTVTNLLRERLRFDGGLWSYGVYHQDRTAASEFLRTQGGFLATSGPVLVSPLVTIDPIERGTYEHVEFRPLINARAHRFGDEHKILDGNVAQQYLAFLDVLTHRAEPTALDWLSATYYLLLQDRVADAFEAFARVAPGSVDTRLQYDAVRAYLAFYTDDPSAARPIAEAYRDHPVPRWRARFREVLAQLDEIDGAAVTVVDPEDRAQRQAELAANAPVLELEVEPGSLRIASRNLETCEARFYEMDVEFLFSMSPFAQASSDAFAFVQPNARLSVQLTEGATTVALPAELAAKNLVVEIDGGGVVRRGTHFQGALVVEAVEQYGHVRVLHAETGEPLSRVYVKVYGRGEDGTDWFHKDGYTDHRGRFDYASLTTTAGRVPARFAVLVMSETDGAVIRELEPPLK